MNANYAKFNTLNERDRKDVFEAAAGRLGTNAQSIEKDLWVCRVLDAPSGDEQVSYERAPVHRQL